MQATFMQMQATRQPIREQATRKREREVREGREEKKGTRERLEKRERYGPAEIYSMCRTTTSFLLLIDINSYNDI